MAQDSGSLPETLDSPASLIDQRQASSPPPPNTSPSPPSSSSSDPALSRNSSFSRLNAQAPEFVPRSSPSSTSPSLPRPDGTQPRLVVPPPQATPPGLLHLYPGPNSAFHVPVHGGHVAVPVQKNHHYPHHVPVQYHPQHHRPQYYGGGFVDHQDVTVQGPSKQQPPVELDHPPALKNGLSEEAIQKILNQVEYYFSDINLATTDHLMRFINKDAEGFVPISVVASFKKIKALVSSNSQLANVLRNSTKLVVSDDGKKVRRQHPLTELDMEELQSRIVVAENLPPDHCHQNLMRLFSAVGSVKTIRSCQPQTSNGGASSASRSGKVDHMLFSNKLHAFVEYESVELAEKAVAELNDEANWRSGLRVRLLLRRTAKSGQPRGKKSGHEGDALCEEDDTCMSEHPPLNEKLLDDPSQQYEAQSHEYPGGEEHCNDKDCGQKKGRGRGRGKGRGRGQHNQNNNNRGGMQVGSPVLSGNSPVNSEQLMSSISKQPPGPRMPDGTRGFSMGRGRPLTVNTA
ncbi:hypothetical protein NMG60_11028811 [Bertholletia excelsa]